MDDRGIAVIIADAELLAQVYPVDLFPQRLVAEIVKVEAADQIPAVFGMGIALGHRAQALPDGQKIRITDLMLPLMAVMDVHDCVLAFRLLH